MNGFIVINQTSGTRFDAPQFNGKKYFRSTFKYTKF